MWKGNRMRFPWEKRNGKRWHHPVVVEQMVVYWDKVPEGKAGFLDMTTPRSPKSYQQVKTHWGLVIAMTKFHFDQNYWDTSYLYNLPKPTGVPVEPEDISNHLYIACPTYSSSGKRVTLSNMDTAQAKSFFDRSRDYLANRWSIIIPDPNPDWNKTKEKA